MKSPIACSVQVWSLPQGQCKMTLHGHQAAVTSVQFDQSRIISGSLDRFIKIWSITSGQVCMNNNFMGSISD